MRRERVCVEREHVRREREREHVRRERACEERDQVSWEYVGRESM